MYFQPAPACAERSKSLVLLLCDSSRFDQLWRDDRGAVPLIGRGKARLSIARHVRGKKDSNGCSPTRFTLGLHASAVQLRDVFDDCQSKTRAAELPAARFIGAIEALENPWQISFADPNPIIGHAKHDLRTVLGRSQTNLSVLTRIFQGVIQQIIENFMQPGFVRADRPRIRRKIDNYFQLLLRQLFFPIADDT